jgi:hypothetical protein
MSEEVTPQVNAGLYEQGIEILEAELERMKTIASLDNRAKERVEAALEDLKKKAAAAE